MMSVNELLQHRTLSQKVSVEGCIVIIDGKLWLIDSSHVNNFPDSVKIAITNSHLKSILLKSVALYSGVTSLFHDARISGHIFNDNSLHSFALNIDDLCIKDGENWKRIDVNAFVEDKENNEPDWFDILK
ncbi:MAG: hypothetical protein E6265_26210 [Enterobacteriaceae bacterium]|jgi:hypothetical protein|nr:hypothetical protein [Enterobacteriaceae bacterium]